jgi:hypothetical protein
MAICSSSQTGKKMMLTVPVRTVRTVTWKCRTIMMTWKLDDVAHFHWLVFGKYGIDTCPDCWQMG